MANYKEVHQLSCGLLLGHCFRASHVDYAKDICTLECRRCGKEIICHIGEAMEQR